MKKRVDHPPPLEFENIDFNVYGYTSMFFGKLFYKFRVILFASLEGETLPKRIYS